MHHEDIVAAGSPVPSACAGFPPMSPFGVSSVVGLPPGNNDGVSSVVGLLPGNNNGNPSPTRLKGRQGVAPQFYVMSTPSVVPPDPGTPSSSSSSTSGRGG